MRTLKYESTQVLRPLGYGGDMQNESSQQNQGIQRKTLIFAVLGAVGFGVFVLAVAVVLFLLSGGDSVNIVDSGKLPEDILVMSSMEDLCVLL